MSLDISINFNQTKEDNYFLSHPYSYSNLSDADKGAYYEEDGWSGNITHNLGAMASHVPIEIDGVSTTLYQICWRPNEVFDEPTTTKILPFLIKGICYMLEHRKDLLQYNPKNGWGSYNGFMKFLLNYKQACEDNEDCKIYISR